SGSVYNWLPVYLSASTSQVNSSTNERRVAVAWYWDQAGLNNLVVDGNEAIEAEVLFYNYGPGTGIPGNGYAYMNVYPPISWSTNLPNGYLDTRFMDSGEEVSFAVGTATPQLLSANTTYSFSMNAFPAPFIPSNGLWQINFQRGD